MNPNKVTTIYKKAAETFDVEVDFANWLATGDTVSTHDVEAYEGDSDVTSTLIGTTSDDDNSKVTFVLKSGTAGHQYDVYVEATTTNSDVWVAEITVVVN